MTLEELARQALRALAAHLAGTVVSIVGFVALIVAVAIVRRKHPLDVLPSERTVKRAMYAAIGVVILAFLALLIINNR
jgi:uncharacterized membrane protein